MRCFRLKSSPPKKTFRLRCFFFMGAGAHTKPPRGRPDNSIHAGAPRSRGQVERVLRGPGQEGGRIPPHPRLMPRAEVGREGIGGLPPGHLENPLVLMARSNRESLARP